ncbi:MAG: GGDEF domain-containing protein [Bilophila wadsworthia]
MFRYTNDPSVPASVGRLAEQIGTLIVQKEVREFQLENLIEDLFSTRTALAQARHDPLTGLPNRAMFEEMLHKACGSALECGSGLALLLVDFDRFKEVNDSLGHAAGDELLVQGAARLQGCVGDRGLIGRMGGDEFAVLLIEQAEGDVLRTAECILRRSVPHFRCKRKARISSSVGVAFHSLEAATPRSPAPRTPMSPCIALRVKGGIGCGAIARQRSPIADMAECFSG